jgi:hypothetical protein
LSSEQIVGLLIRNLTVSQAHEVAELIRDLTLKDLTKRITIWVETPGKTPAEVEDILHRIFTPLGVGG